MGLGHPGQGSVYDIHTVQEFPLGYELEWEGGLYVYAKAGGATIAGSLAQGPATKAGHVKMAIEAAVAAGRRDLRVVQAAVIAIDEYKNGQLVVATNGATIEFTAEVLGNEAGAVPGTGQINARVMLKRPIPVALEAGAIVTLVPNPFNGAVLALAPPTQIVLGVSMRSLANGQFGWLQVRGHGAMRQEGTVTVGQPLIASSTTDGSVEAIGTAGATYTATEQAIINRLADAHIVGTAQDGGGADGDLFPALIHVR